MQTSRIFLASSSPYRRALLARLGLGFEWRNPAVDESPQPNEAPDALAKRLARAKASAVAATVGEPAVVIGSDQVASLAGAPTGKPGSRELAQAQLRRASGNVLEFYTAVAVVAGSHVQTDVDVTRVRFRDLSDAEIEHYLDREQPYDCAGSFKAEGLGIALFESIESSDPTALIGLPLILLCRQLRAIGIVLP
ncbi:MAG TPA: Maf family nucleotide pyrophosphatase [Gammaproteobacteria bacterium]|nr:Maf family nucleotide pyrophosphatase [Gammaproteobacteria bacterium]